MPELTTRQAQVVERVARGLPDKEIAERLDISVRTVQRHVQDAAARIPGHGRPRHRLTLFFLSIEDDPSG
jgi:DNA-binding NarL/FixJ family response regulator